jgi:hypothetical protein
MQPLLLFITFNIGWFGGIIISNCSTTTEKIFVGLGTIFYMPVA